MSSSAFSTLSAISRSHEASALPLNCVAMRPELWVTTRCLRSLRHKQTSQQAGKHYAHGGLLQARMPQVTSAAKRSRYPARTVAFLARGGRPALLLKRIMQPTGQANCGQNFANLHKGVVRQRGKRRNMRQSSKFASLLVTLPMQPKAGPSSPGSAMAPHDSRTNRDQEVKMCLVVSNVHQNQCEPCTLS